MNPENSFTTSPLVQEQPVNEYKTDWKTVLQDDENLESIHYLLYRDSSDWKSPEEREELVEKLTIDFQKGLEEENNFLEQNKDLLERAKVNAQLAINQISTDYQVPPISMNQVRIVGKFGYVELFLSLHNEIRIPWRISAGEYVPHLQQTIINIQDPTSLVSSSRGMDLQAYLEEIWIHESLHLMGHKVHDDQGQLIGSGISGFGTLKEYGYYAKFEEGLVDVLANDYHQELYKDRPQPEGMEKIPESCYVGEKEFYRTISTVVPSHYFTDAHFHGKYEELRNSINSIYGPDGFQFFTKEASSYSTLPLLLLTKIAAAPIEGRVFRYNLLDPSGELFYPESVDKAKLKELVKSWVLFLLEFTDYSETFARADSNQINRLPSSLQNLIEQNENNFTVWRSNFVPHKSVKEQFDIQFDTCLDELVVNITTK